jgi:hypothetical protein
MTLITFQGPPAFPKLSMKPKTRTFDAERNIPLKSYFTTIILTWGYQMAEFRYNNQVLTENDTLDKLNILSGAVIMVQPLMDEKNRILKELIDKYY